MIKELYVAPNGNDNACGNKENPLATFEAARKKVHEIRSENEIPVTVYFRGGEYDMSKFSVKFTSEDSGSEKAPITYKAYENEKPIFTGELKLDMSMAKKVTDETIKASILDPNAREGLYSIDISDIWDIAPEPVKAFSQKTPTLYRNSTPMFYSRWPSRRYSDSHVYESEYLYTPHIIHDEPRDTAPFHICVSMPVLDHIKRCWRKESLDNVWLTGYLWHNWFHDNYHITSFDYDDNTVTIANSIHAYCCDVEPQFKYRRYYFYNILEEISDHNEFYIDREKKLLYFYPESENDVIKITYNNGNALSFNNVQYITLDGLEFSYFIHDIISVSSGSHITINNCTISHGCDSGIQCNGCKNLTISNNHIFDMGAIGVIACNAGVQKTFTSGNILIEYNDIHDVARLKRCGSGNINVWGSVNTIIRKNKLHANPQTALWVEGIDTIVEYNEIYDVTRDTDDASAVYWGRVVNAIGTRIRYNYFHDIGQNDTSTWSIGAIYIDDNATGGEIYGNIFHHAAIFGDDNTYKQNPHDNNCTIVLNDSQFIYAHDNIILTSTIRESPMHDIDHRALINWTKSALGAYIPKNPQSHGMQTQWREVLENIGFFGDDKINTNPLWVEHYKGTEWEPMFEILKGENYTSGAVDENGNTYGIPDIIKQFNDGKITLDESTQMFRDYAKIIADKMGAEYTANTFERNVVINMNPKFLKEDGDAFIVTPHKDNIYISLDDAHEYFKDVDNADYTLTEKGEKTIKSIIKNFDCLNKLSL